MRLPISLKYWQTAHHGMVPSVRDDIIFTYSSADLTLQHT